MAPRESNLPRSKVRRSFLPIEDDGDQNLYVSVAAQTEDCTGTEENSSYRFSYAYFFYGICTTAVIASIAIAMFPYPLRASCTVQWKFDEPCTFMMQRLRSQILKWSKRRECAIRNKCLYVLKDANGIADTIRAVHLSSRSNKFDDIEIEFFRTRNNTCVAKAKSISRGFFVIFDDGKNYCNLRNLVNGAELDSDRGFAESTNEAICTQVNTVVCL